MNNTRQGFTLIEIMVVITIIGLLSVVIIGSLQTARDKAKIASTKIHLDQFKKMAITAQGDSRTTLGDLTGTNSTQDACLPVTRYLPDVTDSDPCYTTWIHALESIRDSNSVYSNIEGFKRDQWGSPFIFDENELEIEPLNLSNPCNCRHDVIASAGPNGIFESRTTMSGQGISAPACYNQYFSGDDFGIILPFSKLTSCSN